MKITAALLMLVGLCVAAPLTGSSAKAKRATTIELTPEIEALTIHEFTTEYAGCGVHGGTVICD
ncbi:hypothetical protein H2200_013395 [Cladophialophora chaetospira]|uniref:Uncharacterized protein n=1 Tax=Cladophialophora chaetospira TaxID=386627 RepID=A0AA38WUH1_9EURO|nr:hypothetical protein H2200_013395 [Cladophialophora chaetospira]